MSVVGVNSFPIFTVTVFITIELSVSSIRPVSCECLNGLLKVFKFESKNQYIKIYTKEFIAVCPFSGLPDIAKITIEYFPKGGLALELKALKYYLISYKNVGIYQEEVTKNIHLDLKEILNTDKIKITTEYNVRGGLYTTCVEGSM